MSGKKHGDKRKIEAISEDDKTKIKRDGAIPMVDDKTKMKRSSRNASEKRRRDKLNTYINELSAMVPSCSSPHSSRKLDKSTILKLTVSYMKLHADLLSPSPNESTVSWKPAFLSNEELATLMLEALDGFLFVLSVTGRILYVSHTVAPLLGHLQNSLIGRSLFDLVHETDRGILDNTLQTHFNSEMMEASSSTGSKAKVSFSLRMLRGGMSAYELVHCSGNVRRWEDAIKNPNQDGVSELASMTQGLLETEDNPTHCLVAVGKMEAPKIIRDISSVDLGKNEYLSRHNLEAKYLYVDNKAPSIIGYLPSEVIGCSAYDFYHLEDLSILSVNHKNLMNHGNSTTMFYRFLTKGQQWIWMQTHGYVETNKWTNKPETIICHNVVVSYSKVLEYLHARALEYGPALPPVAIGNARSPHEVLINSLTSNHKAQMMPSDRISDVTPGRHKEEPPSPPNINVGQSAPPAAVAAHFTNLPPIPDNLFPRSAQAICQIETMSEDSSQGGQIYAKMDISPAPSAQEQSPHAHLQEQHLQHMSVQRGPVINLPAQQPASISHLQQHVQMAQQQQPAQGKHQQNEQHMMQQQQQHVSPGPSLISLQQQPAHAEHHAMTSQHQVTTHHVSVPAQTQVNHLPPTSNGGTHHQAHLAHATSNGTMSHTQQMQMQQVHVQNAAHQRVQHRPVHVQTHQQQQPQIQTTVVQQHAPQLQSQSVGQSQHYSQPSTPDKHVHSPAAPLHIQAGGQPQQQQQQQQQSHSNPATPHHVPQQQQPAPQQPSAPRHASPQVVLLPSGQHGYLASQSQLRPTINLQGMQYMAVNNSSGVETTVAPALSPGTPATPHPTTQQEFTSPGSGVKAPGNMAHYSTSQVAGGQQYSIIPTSAGNIHLPNNNVIMLQPVPSAGGGTQYQLAQLYPLIQAVNPGNGAIAAALPQKLVPQNGTHIDISRTLPTSTCYSLPGVKREQVRRVKSPAAPFNMAQCGSEKVAFRTDDYNLASAGSDHNMLDHFDPEVISMILNNTNIDNYNLDNQWNHNLFDNPPNSTHSTSSNPSPISAHSPGT